MSKPTKGEKKSAFIGRCVSEMSHVDKERDHDQIVAMCYTSWDDNHKQAEGVDDMVGERYLFFSGVKSGEIKFSELDFDKESVPIKFLDTKMTTNDVKWEKQAIHKLKDVMVQSGKNKMFAGHDYDFFSGGPGTRPPGDWVASVDLDTLKIVQENEETALIGEIKVLGGTETREALRNSIRQDPTNVAFSVDVIVPRSGVKHIREGEKIFQVFSDIVGYNSTDWVSYGASKDAGLLFQRFSETLYNLQKEVKQMDFAEYQKLHPDEVKKYEEKLSADIQAKFADDKKKADEELAKAKADLITLKQAAEDAKKAGEKPPLVDGEVIRKLESRIDQLEKDNKDKELQIAVMRTAQSEKDAASIMDSALKGKAFPDEVSLLIREQFNHKEYLKEDKTLDTEKFTQAVTTKVTAVATSLEKERQKTVIGVSFSESNKTENDADVDYGKKVFIARFGEKKKAQ